MLNDSIEQLQKRKSGLQTLKYLPFVPLQKKKIVSFALDSSSRSSALNPAALPP